MAVDSFASPMDMENRSLGQITATSHPFLEDELEAATSAIREYCGWHIATLQAVTLIRRFHSREHVYLPAMRIVGVVAATIDGVVLTADDLAAVEFDPVTGWTSLSGRSVSVVFDAGFTSVPADLKLLTLELSAGALGSPLGITKEQAGGVSVTLDRASGAITEQDYQRLVPYKLGRLP